MPVQDTALVLATDIDVTTSANGATVTVNTAGSTLGNLGNGSIHMAHMRIEGAFEHDSNDETLSVFIEESDGSLWNNIGVFPTITAATASALSKFFYTLIQNGLGIVSIPIFVHPWATGLRYRTVTGGTIGGTTANDMNIWIVPGNWAPSKV